MIDSKWAGYRQLARTDLLFLCRTVLGYKDVCKHVHGDVLLNLQRFRGGKDIGEVVRKDGKQYVPDLPDLWELGGPKRTLNLIPRGHLKSTICTIAHTIQWIINYPDIRMHIVSATLDNAEMFLTEIKGHFTNNAEFRALFPEFCPQGKEASSFGNKQEFTVPNRTRERKEPTVSVSSIEKPLAGPHFEVMKCDDVVTAGNCRTKDQIETIKQNFGLLDPLIETHAHRTGPTDGWLDVIGTRYDFADLYGTIIEGEESKPPERKIWSIVVKSAAPNYPDGPYLWPERYGLKKLKEIEEDPSRGPAVLSSQYLMNPVPVGTGLVDDISEIRWVPANVVNQLYSSLSLYAAVDLAGMETNKKGKDNDYTAVSLGGFGRDGRLYILDVWWGRPKPDEVINYLFDLYKRHPRLINIKIEKENHARVLLPFLKREQERRGIQLPILEIQRDNQQSKEHKIRGLQPMLKNQTMIFSEAITCKTVVTDEIVRFNRWHDDVLDTLRDLMDSGRGITSDVIPRPKPVIQQLGPKKFVGFDPYSHQDVWEDSVLPGWSGDPITGL